MVGRVVIHRGVGERVGRVIVCVEGGGGCSSLSQWAQRSSYVFSGRFHLVPELRLAQPWSAPAPLSVRLSASVHGHAILSRSGPEQNSIFLPFFKKMAIRMHPQLWFYILNIKEIFNPLLQPGECLQLYILTLLLILQLLMRFFSFGVLP